VEHREGNRVPGDIIQRFPMREWGWTIGDVYNYLSEQEITIPARTDCAWCFFQTIAEWKALLEKHPESFQEAIDIERRMNHTFRSPGRDTWPADLQGLKDAFENGRQPRNAPSMDARKAMCSVCAR